jgi:DNA-binding beta-propeller fold protein YncE
MTNTRTRLFFAGRAGIFSIVCCLVAITFAFAQVSAAGTSTQTPAAASGRYQVVHGWPVLPAGEVLGPVAGVGVDSKDNVFVFRRGDRVALRSGDFDLTPIPRPTIWLFDGRTGAVLAQRGSKTFAMPHGLAVDRQDNVWLTDVAYHQVYKFTHDGHLLLTIGERGVPGSDEAHFNRPTDIAVAEDGSFYVSDGYRNSRVVKFAADGKFLFQWEKRVRAGRVRSAAWDRARSARACLRGRPDKCTGPNLRRAGHLSEGMEERGHRSAL